MDKPSKKPEMLLSASVQTESPDHEDLLMAGSARTQALARAVKAVRLALASELSTDLPNTEAQTEEHLHLPNRWAAKICGLKTHDNRWLDEDVHLHECVALSSWENR